MSSKDNLTPSEKQDLSLQPLAVTVPFLRPVDGIHNFLAEVRGDAVSAQGSGVPVALNGQEFARFAGIRTPAHVEGLAAEYGLLGIHGASEAVHRLPLMQRPLWWWALTRGPEHWAVEPIEDWIRQAGLIDLAYGLLGLMVQPSMIDVLAEHTKGLPHQAASMKQLLAAQDAGAAEEPWPVRLILQGAARAGMMCQGLEEEEEQLWLGPHPLPSLRRWVSFWSPGWRIVSDDQDITRLPPSFSIEATPDGVARSLAGLLDPWLDRVRHGFLVRDGKLKPGLILPGDLLGELWLQLGAAAQSEVPPRECAWERCPGPPERPGIFLWRWGQTPSGTKHRDSVYCHRLCQHAALMARRRKKDAREAQRKAVDPR